MKTDVRIRGATPAELLRMLGDRNCVTGGLSSQPMPHHLSHGRRFEPGPLARGIAADLGQAVQRGQEGGLAKAHEHRKFKSSGQGPRRTFDGLEGLKCLDLAPVPSRLAVSAVPWTVHQGRWRSRSESACARPSARRPGTDGPEVGFRTRLQAGSKVTVQRVIKTNRMFDPSMSYEVLLEGTQLPKAIPIRLDLFHGNEGEGAMQLNPKLYRSLRSAS